MMIPLKTQVKMALLAGVAVLSMGVGECETEYLEALWDPKVAEELARDPSGMVSLHQMVKKAVTKDLEVPIESYYGEPVTIERIPLLGAKDIKRIEAIPVRGREGSYHLQLYLTERGRKLWWQLSVEYKSSSVAFVIDGMFYRSFRPVMLPDDETLVVAIDDIDFDQATALELQLNSVRNFKKMNR